MGNGLGASESRATLFRLYRKALRRGEMFEC